MPYHEGYRDATATYIRMAKIPSYMYAKHQYRKESECGSTVALYIPTELYNTQLSQSVIKYYIYITSSGGAKI